MVWSSGTLFNPFFPLLHLLLGRYAFHLWRPLSQVITEAAKKLPSAVSVRNEQTIFNIHFEKKVLKGTSLYLIYQQMVYIGSLIVHISTFYKNILVHLNTF